MNKLEEVEQYIKRQKLAEMMDTHPNYLCAVARYKEVSPDLKRRLIEAVDKVIEELKRIKE